ncbi:DEAD/DEAH box helicase [Vallitalea pronyensis]|uniref:DEAD/DEAH box helicase n=1 Tax=Vallitalea pronyensis TaxID=1348613 RepID=UPI001BAF6098|nr:DEAD/DEAH box helicase family protein [Vallitalea pronyensis]
MEENFWVNYDILFDPEDMPVVEEYEPEMLQSSLEKCDFVITNVHKLYNRSENSLLSRVKNDFFDMVIIDEAHHSVATTWQDALEYFSSAKKLHLTGTPYRGDGKDIPGEPIHTTQLSEVMRMKLVKGLRNATINNNEIYFTIKDDDKRYSIDEVIKLKDKEWVEKSVALSKECSVDVIKESIKELKKIKEISTKVPHKILAIACSIVHAQDVALWYEEMGQNVIIIHSKMSKEDRDKNLLDIEEHKCDVVVSVDMLKEGYDHRYLSVLAIFRPYRSKNAFAQIVGRVLRIIPEEEVTDYGIDNNACVVYHEEIGLDKMWNDFKREVAKSTIPPKEYPDYEFSDREYTERSSLYGGIETGEAFVADKDSFLGDIDFNQMFEDAKRDIENNVNETFNTMMKNVNLDEETKK